MSERRVPGTLEAEVLRILAAASAPMSPEELQAALDGALAYSTITTVLARLRRKGMVTRTRAGRRYAYESVTDEATLVAGRMTSELRRSDNHHSVLQLFITDLDVNDAASLRTILDNLDER